MIHRIEGDMHFILGQLVLVQINPYFLRPSSEIHALKICTREEVKSEDIPGMNFRATVLFTKTKAYNDETFAVEARDGTRWNQGVG
mmetsp:Transcript_34032/g.101685  ORF Transcript_34032/g.101685 Transcript_34032/m.101685 type:complete len:86 (+) Transcript_34032:311-568(+)